MMLILPRACKIDRQQSFDCKPANLFSIITSLKLITNVTLSLIQTRAERERGFKEGKREIEPAQLSEERLVRRRVRDRAR